MSPDPQWCRVKGCVALASPPPDRPSRVIRLGICVAHNALNDDDLKILLKREAGMVGQLKRINVGIEYERKDGTRYGYDHDGNYYDVS